MITLPVSAQMYQTVVANIQHLQTNPDGTVSITPMQVDKNTSNKAGVCLHESNFDAIFEKVSSHKKPKNIKNKIKKESINNTSKKLTRTLKNQDFSKNTNEVS